MRRVISFVLVLCLLAGFTSVAFAAITITQQPQTQTVKAGGSVTFKVKAKNASGQAVTWYLTSPSGEVTTAKKLPTVVKGVKVSNPNNLTMTLKKVPEELHGWSLYCHIGPKSGGVNSDVVMILIAGLEPPTFTPQPIAVSDDSSSASTSEESASETASIVTVTPEPAQPVVIKASKLDLYALDRSGNPTGAPQSELTFSPGSKANFYVKLPEGTDGYIQYVTLGGLRLTPEGDVTGMSIRGWTDSATVKVKIITEEERAAAAEKAASAAAAAEPVDESSLVTVECMYCRFTGWNNSFAEKGKVPVGSTITVMASGGQIAKGYFINGAAKGEYKDLASFQMVVEGDTTIIMERQK